MDKPSYPANVTGPIKSMVFKALRSEIFYTRCLSKLTCWSCAGFLLIFCTLFPRAHATNLHLQLLAELGKDKATLQDWLAPLPNPADQQQYYLANKNGQIFVLDDDNIVSAPLLDLSQALGASETVLLTAFALHPNFAIPNQLGYSVFYTAHVERRSDNIQLLRLQDRTESPELSHDAVITEWRLNRLDKQQTELSSKREVLRIAINKPEENISYLAFDPNSRSWRLDYGLLYIALQSSADLNTIPLYSGVILRINPNKIGIANYTVPAENPFMKNMQIQDEIIILGVQQLNDIIWFKQKGDKFLLSHRVGQQDLFSMVQKGAYLKGQSSLKLEWQIPVETPLNSSIFYQGNELSSLLGKAVVLTQQAEQWHLSSLSVNDKPGMYKERLFTEWKIDPSKISGQNTLSIHSSHNNELLLLDHSTNTLYKIVSLASAEQSFGLLWWFIALLLLATIGFVVLKQRAHNIVIQSKALLGYEFAGFELNALEQTISLFRRYVTVSHTTLKLANIVSSEIYLNEKAINLVNAQAENGFDEDKENSLREYFVNEKRQKMIDEKTRKIVLVLRDNNQHEYLICAYQRKGHKRATSMKYNDVIDQVLDWSWHIAKLLNPQGTPERPIKPVPIPVLNNDKDSDDWYGGDSTERVSTAKKASTDDDLWHSSTKVKDAGIIVNVQHEQSQEEDKTQAIKSEKDKVDTDLVDALAKLVELKKQGYLTDEEFILSKTNMLERLSKKD